MAKTFQEENDELLQYILETALYSKWKDKDPTTRTPIIQTVELNVTAACNQKCTYCYLVKHGDELYPKEIRDQKTILRNERLLLEYLAKNNYQVQKLEIFSGEIWATKFGWDVLQVIYDILESKKLLSDYIMIPSNMSFLLDRKARAKIEDFIEKFKNIGVRLAFSISVDGKYLEEENRPFNDEDKNEIKTMDDWYNFLFTWAKKYKYAFHPMVAASGIEKWIDNYKWWNDMYKKFKLDPFEYGMYLEVRNDDWTLEKINTYLDVVNYMVDNDLSICQYDIKSFMTSSVAPEEHRGYFPYILIWEGIVWGCSVNLSLIVRLGDLAIGPCHRTCYEQFIYGYYRLNEDETEIIGVDAKNVQLANLVLCGTINGLSKCGSCIIKDHCLRGCLGSQLESTNEILTPIPSVCNLFKARAMFLYMKYKKIGIYEIIKNMDQKNDKVLLLKKLENDCNKLKKGEPKLWNYWEQKIMNKISQSSL